MLNNEIFLEVQVVIPEQATFKDVEILKKQIQKQATLLVQNRFLTAECEVKKTR